MKKFFLISMMIIISMLLSSCATTSDASDAYPNESAKQIFQAGKKSLQDNSYAEAVKRFEALDIQYPFGKDTELAQLYLIYAYYMKEDYALSVAAADRFIRMHPVNPHVDYAYYMRGIANYYQNQGLLDRVFGIDLATRDLTQIQKSFADFKEVAVRYPSSRYASSAYQYMIFLRNVLADHKLHIAEYYFKRRAYVASANRASDIVLHYQGAPSVKPALELMAKSYHRLKLAKKEQDTLLLLHYNERLFN